jgi:hypothetical protein
MINRRIRIQPMVSYNACVELYARLGGGLNIDIHIILRRNLNLKKSRRNEMCGVELSGVSIGLVGAFGGVVGVAVVAGVDL